MLGSLRSLARSDQGAIAPLTAMTLFGLIAVGGIAFDYARLASMDTELQQAADQAALAAATQLDRLAGAQARASTAIQDPASANRLAANLTRFANDGNADDTSVEIADITFCAEFDDSEEDTTAACEEAEDDSDSRFVIVTTRTRTAEYALTPIVAAFSGDIQATAVAGVESAICNVAPLMVCVADDDFPTTEDIGKGIIMKVAGGNAWAPGNYGYLDFGSGNQGVIDALLGFGLDGCQSEDDTVTEPGNKNATDAINTRMDIYDGTGATNSPSVCDVTTGEGCPALNTRKDMAVEMTYRKRQLVAPTAAEVPACTAPAGGNPTSGQISYDTKFTQQAQAKNFGRDICHYLGTCPDQNFGNATWDRDAYLAANHNGVTAADIATDLGGGATAGTLTRWQVYQWEIKHKDDTPVGRLDRRELIVSTTSSGPAGNPTWEVKKLCMYNQPHFASAAYPEQKDRRVLSIVAANCDELAGKGNSEFGDFKILRVFDVFLTEPSWQRSITQTGYAGTTVPTDDKEIYGEVIGPGDPVGGGGGFQYYSRNRPYLVR
ncbi:MAG TPA: pilus assembly protein TadG-related protein [Sphingomicrobium sp.]